MREPRAQVTPAFPFGAHATRPQVRWRGGANGTYAGHGLSYTTFIYFDLQVAGRNVTCGITATGALRYVCGKMRASQRGVGDRPTVTARGLCSGSEVVQLYISYPASADEPPIQLRCARALATRRGAFSYCSPPPVPPLPRFVCVRAALVDVGAMHVCGRVACRRLCGPLTFANACSCCATGRSRSCRWSRARRPRPSPSRSATATSRRGTRWRMRGCRRTARLASSWCVRAGAAAASAASAALVTVSGGGCTGLLLGRHSFECDAAELARRHQLVVMSAR